MKNVLLSMVCALIFSGCANSNEKDKKPVLVFDKLVGTWKLSEEDQFERWKKNEDGTYSSQMFSVAGKDTSITEDVKIIKESDKWNFITLVKGQNKGKSVTFTSTVLTDTFIQFENPAHDFPRMINYNLLSKDRLSAFIAGTTDTIYFNFTRVISK